jgi:hypothetical protein
MDNHAFDVGPWIVDLFVNRRKVGGVKQCYPPHASLPPKIAKPGGFFLIEFVHVYTDGGAMKGIAGFLTCVIP